MTNEKDNIKITEIKTQSIIDVSKTIKYKYEILIVDNEIDCLFEIDKFVCVDLQIYVDSSSRSKELSAYFKADSLTLIDGEVTEEYEKQLKVKILDDLKKRTSVV
jgi:hypothetical protein